MTTTNYRPDGYLPDATDYTDISVKDRPDLRFPSMAGDSYVLCPKCHGHGCWNLKLHAYAPAPGDPRGKRQHFQAACGQCWGWGWVEAGSRDATCLHSYGAIAPNQPFRCWHTIRCTTCGETKSYSSDD
jgi:hypothetical protein